MSQNDDFDEIHELRAWVEAALTRYEAPLLRFAASIVGPSLAQDVVQDTFVKLCKEPRSKVEGHLAAWLFTVCRNGAIEQQRTRQRLRNLEDDDMQANPDSGPARKVERREALSRAGAAIQALPEKQRQVLTLKLDAELSYKEIAQIMDLSVSNVGFIIHQALTRVRAELEASEASFESSGRMA